MTQRLTRSPSPSQSGFGVKRLGLAALKLSRDPVAAAAGLAAAAAAASSTGRLTRRECRYWHGPLAGCAGLAPDSEPEPCSLAGHPDASQSQARLSLSATLSVGALQ